MSLPCTGVVLAGGRSSRMGRDKALLPWRGQPLLERQVAVLREAGLDTVKVSGNRPAYDGIADLQAGAGPVAGLVSVAREILDDTTLLVVPVDMPLLCADLLRRLRNENPAAGCLHFAGEILPLRLRLDARSRGVLATVAGAQEAHRRSLRAVQQSLDAAEVPLSEAEAEQLTDCNTPGIWEELTA